MKVWSLLLLTCLLCLAGAAAPAAARRQTPGVAVVKCGWEKVRISPRPSLAPLAGHEELVRQSQRQRQLAAARNSPGSANAARAENDVIRAAQAEAKSRQTAPPRDGYRYKVTLRNDGDKTITSLDWDYLFIDASTGKEVARHQFTSDETLKPGKKREVSVLYLEPPLKTISIRMLDKKGPSPLTEKVVLVRLQFSDGSVWRVP